MKVAFAGTPRFGALVLGALLRSRHEIVLVITQPDRPAGRGRELRTSAVKDLALQAGIDVFQPERISTGETVAQLRDRSAEVLTVAAFGQILKEPLLGSIPCVNVHGSLLPEYRGAAPVERAIMDGRRQTGVSIMEMEAGLDTGQVYIVTAVPIGPDDNAEAIYQALGEAGGVALVEALDLLEAGSLSGSPQDDSRATYAGKIEAEDRRIDWSRAAIEVHNRVRALSPHIGAYSKIGAQQLKIWKARPELAVTGAGAEAAGTGAAAGSHRAAGQPPGSVIIDGRRLLVACADAVLELLEVQPQGKRRMHADEFLRGYRRLVEGTRLG